MAAVRAQVLTAKMNLSDDVDLEDYVSRPEKLSGAEIACVVQEAGMHAVRANRYIVLPKDFEKGYKVRSAGCARRALERAARLVRSGRAGARRPSARRPARRTRLAGRARAHAQANTKKNDKDFEFYT